MGRIEDYSDDYIKAEGTSGKIVYVPISAMNTKCNAPSNPYKSDFDDVLGEKCVKIETFRSWHNPPYIALVEGKWLLWEKSEEPIVLW